jgi:hypothetical protein
MALIKALIIHAWLAIKLKHDGSGMPVKLPAAFLLIAIYIALNLVNASMSEGIHLQTLFGLSFITQFYLFGLRNRAIGLIIMISIITNASYLMLTTLVGIVPEDLLMLQFLEGIMIFAAIINIIKREFHAI